MTNYTDEGKKALNNHEIIVIVNFVLNVPLILISITGNSLVLAAILKTPSIRTPSMIMISSLAVSDLLVGIMAQPLFLVNEFKNLTERNLLLHSLTSLAGFFVCGVSLGTTTLTCVDRFMAVQYHMRYSSIVTKPRVLYTVVVTWLFTFLCLGLLLEQAFVTLAGRNLHRYMSNYLHISLHQNIRNCSPPSTADSRPGTSRTQLKSWKPAPYVASEKKRLQHFLVLHLHGHLFFSKCYFNGLVWYGIYKMAT